MKSSRLFQSILELAESRRFPFSDRVKGLPPSEFMSGGSLSGSPEHHSASAEFQFDAGPSKRKDLSRSVFEAVEQGFRSGREFRMAGAETREFEGLVFNAWQLESKAWFATLTLSLIPLSRRKVYAVLGLTESSKLRR